MGEFTPGSRAGPQSMGEVGFGLGLSTNDIADTFMKISSVRQ